jgi:phosphonate transport system permease protein
MTMPPEVSTKHAKAPDEKPVKPSLVAPWVAFIASFIVPGSGHALARRFRKGLILFVCFITIFGLLAWRVQLTARYDTEIVDKILKWFRLDPFLLIISIALVGFYGWIAVDAYLCARNRKLNAVGIFALILVIFFLLGWQIGQINPVKLVTEADEAVPALTRVLWPWTRAITYPEDIITGATEIQSPCTDVQFSPVEPSDNEPYLIADPTCGIPSVQGGQEGTEIQLRGGNFEAGKEVSIWWEDPIGNEFRQRQGGEYLTVIPAEDGTFQVSVVFPYRLLPPDMEDDITYWSVQGRQIASVGEPIVSNELKLVIEKMIETIFIGMMATLFGIVLALPLSFIAARNLMSANQFTMTVYTLTRAVLNVIRSIEPLIWAIIFVIIVGLGPFAGILALTLHSTAALGKLYSEAIESIDPGPIEAIQATGANWLQVVVYAVIPQVIPPFVSFTIYRWDINIRMSTIIGFVGGGGIGFLLAQWIRLLDYRAAGLAVWFIAITVAILDYVSAEIRARYV